MTVQNGEQKESRRLLWQSCFTIMGSPFRVDHVRAIFPFTPHECTDPTDHHLVSGEEVLRGMCIYRLSTDHDISTFRAVLDGWLQLLAPYHTALGMLSQDGYRCFLELWTEEASADGWWNLELDATSIQHLARLGLELDIRIEAGSTPRGR